MRSPVCFTISESGRKIRPFTDIVFVVSPFVCDAFVLILSNLVLQSSG